MDKGEGAFALAGVPQDVVLLTCHEADPAHLGVIYLILFDLIVCTILHGFHMDE